MEEEATLLEREIAGSEEVEAALRGGTPDVITAAAICFFASLDQLARSCMVPNLRAPRVGIGLTATRGRWNPVRSIRRSRGVTEFALELWLSEGHATNIRDADPPRRAV